MTGKFVAGVAALGVFALFQSVQGIDLGRIDPLMLVILVALAALTQRMPVFLFRSSAISVSFASVIASYVLFGTGVGVLVSLVQDWEPPPQFPWLSMAPSC